MPQVTAKAAALADLDDTNIPVCQFWSLHKETIRSLLRTEVIKPTEMTVMEFMRWWNEQIKDTDPSETSDDYAAIWISEDFPSGIRIIKDVAQSSNGSGEKK